MQAEIQEELENIKQVQKSLQKLTKKAKQDKKQKRKSQIEEHEIVMFKNDAQGKFMKSADLNTSSKFLKGQKPIMHPSSNNSPQQLSPYKTAFTLDASLELVSYARKNTKDGTSCSLFTKDFLDFLNLDCNSSFNDLIDALQRIIEYNTILLNPILKKLSMNVLIEYIEILSESNGLTSTYKEKLSELFLLY
ncbi:MAG: hypothetical protein ACTSQF_03975, partial [Candidatus Heimdallarchaeaceae archaeon]